MPELDDRETNLYDMRLVRHEDGWIYGLFCASDTRTHVATSTVDKLLDYVLNTPEDGLRSSICAEQRCRLIEKNARRKAHR
jgi:4-O-beta-D-mannosyl-D-glucose phosphorylase